MFKQAIGQTQMTSEVANEFFHNITGYDWWGDMSFLSTLRALVAPRMQEGERLRLNFSNSGYPVSSASSVKGYIYSLIGEEFGDYTGAIRVHNFTSSTQEENRESLDAVKAAFTDTYSGFFLLDKVTDFFRKTFYVLCFINPEKKSVAIFTDNMDIKKMHYIQCSIFAFLPWYFNPEDGVSEIEMELINSLREKTSTKYEDCISKIADKYDFKTERVKRLLTGFETRYEKQECENVRRRIKSVDNLLEETYRSISEYQKQRRDFELRLLGLETKIEQSGSENSEILDYFLANKKLYLDAADESQLLFSVKGYITYFDEDMAKTIIDKKESYVYRPTDRACNNYIPADDMKRLMYAIFVDQTIKVRFCAAYCFDIANQSVRGISGWTYSADFKDYMPNTHIDAYRCMGNYVATIDKLLTNNDYIGAIEQCIASCQSLNFADSTVMREFMCRMYGIPGHMTNINNRCIELEDGSVVTPKEAAEILRKREEDSE